MRNSLKRLLSLLLVLAMVCSVLPATALAQNADTMIYGRTKMPDPEPEFLVNSLHGEGRDPRSVFPAGFTPEAPAPLANTSSYGDMASAAAQLRAGMVAHQAEVDVYVRTTSSDSSTVCRQIFHDALAHTGQPKEGDYLGWQWDGLSYGRSYSASGGYYYYDITFYVEYYVTAAQEAQVDAAAQRLLDQLDLYDAGDYYKVKGVYDWICANVDYDYDNLNDNSYTLKFTAYAALIDRIAVCQGYALLMYRLLLSLGVDNRLIASVDHGYNIIRLGDYYYYGDTTWDANLTPSQYNYFLQNEANFETNISHIREDCSPYYGWDYDYTSAEFYQRYPMSPTPFNFNNHAHDYEGEVTQPTCTEQGYTTYTCTICLNSYNGSYTDPLGHNYVGGECTRCGDIEEHEHDYEAVVTPPTCTEEGYTTYTCAQCGDSYEDDFVDALGHDWADATCEEPETCTRCEETRGETLGHDYEDGECTRCGEADPDYHEHAYEAVVTDPDCVTEGYTTYTCTICGESYVDDYTDPLGHDWVEATCEEPETCDRCGETRGEALGHDYEDGECTRCGQIELPIRGICGDDQTWVLDEDGLLTVSGTGDMYDYSSSAQAPWYEYRDLVEEILVEGTCDSIGDYAFYQLPNLTTVTIENGVMSIGGHSMKYCESLTSVTIPGSVEEMGVSVFQQSRLLTTAGPITGTYAIEFGWTQTIPDKAFSDHIHLEQVTLPNSITAIGEKAFLKCSGLTSVTLPRELKTISNLAFEQSGLTSVTIPDKVVRIESEAFEYCPLTSVTLGKALTGIGYAAFRNCDELTAVSMPDSLEDIEGSAFEGCSALETLELNEGLVTISASAFDGCSALETVVIPSTVDSLGSSAFRNCTGLTEIEFLGNAPRIDSNAFTNVTADAYYPGRDTTWTEEVRRDYGGDLNWIARMPGIEGVIRLSGSNRYETAFAVADQLKENMGVDKFDCVVVAYGQNFPDALTGSYLASVKGAPILLTEKSMDVAVGYYIYENLKPGGTVYILGGTAAVSQIFETGIQLFGFETIRLKGAGRYETNLAILRTAGVNKTDDILIATGTNYADSLSASATGLPMLLVGEELTADQKLFLMTTSRRFVIIGGTGAVNEAIEAELAEMGSVVRIKGSNRYGTSVEIARRYFAGPQAAVLAYAQGFPDGLCGGPLAISMDAPLILTSDDAYYIADSYVDGISNGVVTGGTGRISDDTVREIFDLSWDTSIPKK